MSETTDPMTAVFEMQRQMIEQTQEMTHEVVDVQKDAVHQFVNLFEDVEAVTEQNNDLSKQAVHAYLDAVDSMLPVESTDLSEFEQLVDDGFDQLTESQTQAFETMQETMTDSATAYDEFADAYVDAVDSSFDSFLDAHERVEADVEDVTGSVSA